VRHEGDLCGRCAQEHAGTTGAPTQPKWINEVPQALEALFANRPALGWPGKASLWDLFALEKYNGGPGKLSDLGYVLERIEPTTLAKLRDWLDNKKEEAVERNVFNSWQESRTFVGHSAWLKQLPPGMPLSPETEDGLPIQLTAIRTDGKKWDLNLPIRAELLRRLPRYFSERLCQATWHVTQSLPAAARCH